MTDTWSHTFDFTLDDGGWSVPSPFSEGRYTPTVGWTDSYGVDAGAGPGGLSGYRSSNITINCSSTILTGFILQYTITLGTLDHGAGNEIIANGTSLQLQSQPATGSGSHTFNWSGSQVGVTSLTAYIVAGISDAAGHPDPGGSVTITQITLSGAGPNPFPIAGDWTQAFDFRVKDGGWSIPSPFSEGRYTPTVGWTDSYGVDSGLGPGGLSGYRSSNVTIICSGTKLTGFIIQYAITGGTYDHAASNDIVANGTGLGYQYQPATGNGSHNINWSGLKVGVTSLAAYIVAGISDAAGHPDPGGSATITKIILFGLGPDPFLDAYCVACAINHIGQDIEEVWDGFFS